MRTKVFLKTYQEQARPYYQQFFAPWLRQAGKTDKLAFKIMDRFIRLYPKGKQHRGALVVLGYQLAGGKKKKDILKASLLTEIFQTAILIADDVFDKDDIRRGEPTIHLHWEKHFNFKNPDLKEAYGRDMALLTTIVGMYLAPLALEKTDFSILVKQNALNYFFRRMVYLGWGEALDISVSFQSFREKKRSAQTIHDLKAVDYSAIVPLHFGAILAGKKDKKWFKNLDQYGLCLGRIFQIQDDIIGSFGIPGKTGKTNKSDIREARWTILVEILWQKAEQKDKQTLKKLFEKTQRGKKEVEKVKALMKKYQAGKQAQKKAKKYLEEGIGIIPKITQDKKQQATLKNLLYFMMERTK